ncbi:hypothetical protein [Macrococcus animalis]|uniref:hypothetical protein n=1 Tax=Macrococcus animalis TaxID=3395467 RepID=UPI0039BDCF11
MTRIIIGGSGMLYKMTETIVQNTNERIILCSRNKASYGELLEYDNVEFQKFDFANQCDYKKLLATINNETITEVIAWIHSHYYEYFEKLLTNPIFDNTTIYLVKGSTRNHFQFERVINIIRLGKHPIENRWLTNEEISELVLNSII